MRDEITVAVDDAVDGGRGVDARGAISRADLFRRALLTGGALVVGGVVVTGVPELAAASKPSGSQDDAILNYLLVVEFLQAAFYRKAVQKGALTGDLLRFAQVAAGDEKTHVNVLKSKLGPKARREPAFHFGSATASAREFAKAAAVLEEAGVSAYIGQGANLTRAVATSVARIASVEGRHAAWIRDILHELPAPRVADVGKSQSDVMAAIKSTSFV
jgi:hypothetical protein